jgi:hypothetical protein
MSCASKSDACCVSNFVAFLEPVVKRVLEKKAQGRAVNFSERWLLDHLKGKLKLPNEASSL